MDQLILPSGKISLLPIWTNVKSCRINPLKFGKKKWFWWNEKFLHWNQIAYIYGMHGGLELANMLRYARNDDEESIKSPYSLMVSVMFFGQSNRLIGAQSNADKMAKYELKLFNLRKHFIIFKNFSINFSRSFWSWHFNICDRAQ